MGMYTELVFGVRLKSNTPESVLDTIDALVGESEGFSDWPNHPFFGLTRGCWPLMSGGSYYFNAVPCLKWDRVGDFRGCSSLTFITNIKNYGQEWQHFLDWIQPYSDSEEIVGYLRYEEADAPSVVWFRPSYVKEGDRVSILPAGKLPPYMEDGYEDSCTY